MKAAPLLINFHDERAPIYSAHFEPHAKGRLATAGGDGNVRIWHVETAGEDRKITYLSTLKKHTQAVNVVRWSPQGELLASASDDGNILLWAPADPSLPMATTAFGDDDSEDKEAWMVKRMCRSQTGSEIYDLAWSPDAAFFITGSMDNIARIFDASTGTVIRQIAEHNHYVQGVAWDPLNEYIATQSSDRSVHIYKLKTSDGQFTLSSHGRVSKMDIHSRRLSQESPAPPDHAFRAPPSVSDSTPHPPGSPAPPSAPGTPMSSSHLPMNPPPPASHSRRSSFGAASPSIARSASPAPSLPLPAVMPAASPNPLLGINVRSSNMYANETLTSFFRRLTFAPDGSLLLTPAGQFKSSGVAAATATAATGDAGKAADDIVNTVYIYSRGGFNKPPIAHLPGHKKPSVAVKCSPIFYNHRLPMTFTKHITIDSSSAAGEITLLPDPILASATSARNNKAAHSQSVSSSMEPPPLSSTVTAANSMPSPAPSTRGASPRPMIETDTTGSAAASSSASNGPPGPPPAFALPYRMVYAVATQDAVYIYDTQQQSPISVISNLHFATFTDLTWSNDGLTLLMSSSDGFCSTVSFEPGELGSVYHGSLSTRLHQPLAINTGGGISSASSTPLPTPTTGTGASASATKMPSASSSGANLAPSQSPTGIPSRPSQSHQNEQYRPNSPTRSNSASSIATQSSLAVPPQTPQGSSVAGVVLNNPTPTFTNLPPVVAGGTSFSSASASPGGTAASSGVFVSPTPPMTPLPISVISVSSGSSGGGNSNSGNHHHHHHQQASASGSASVAPTAGANLSSTLLPPPPPPPHSAAGAVSTSSAGSVIPKKREGENGEQQQQQQQEDQGALAANGYPAPKKRRIAPTLVQTAAAAVVDDDVPPDNNNDSGDGGG